MVRSKSLRVTIGARYDDTPAMDIVHQMDNGCLCSVMYVGSGIGMVVGYSGCVGEMRWMCYGGGVAWYLD